MTEYNPTFAGLGYCSHCNRPNHLYSIDFLEYSFNEMCPPCITMKFDTVIENLYMGDPSSVHCTSERMYGEGMFENNVLTAWDMAHFRDNLYDNRTNITEQRIICRCCNRPILDGQTSVMVRTLWEEDGEVAVHGYCSRTVCEIEDCPKRITLVENGNYWHGNYTRTWRYESHMYYDRMQPSLRGWAITARSFDGTLLCEDHLSEALAEHPDHFLCNPCENYYLISDTAITYYNERFCQSCYDDIFLLCEYCDEPYSENDGRQCGCDNDDEERESIIHSYNYRPYWGRFGNAPYHLGFELEIESTDGELYNCAEELAYILGDRAIYKYDGSVDNGFEVVTHPHSLEEYQTNFPWRFTRKAQSMGFRSWNANSSCGFHVHVGRVGFGPIHTRREGEMDVSYLERTIIVRQRHELRFCKLIYDNQRQVERLAGRPSNQYADFSDKGRLWDKVKHHSQANGRYSVINMENQSTIEIRIFKGSLKASRCLANLEFVHAAVEYTRDLKVTGSNKALSWVRFCGYVGENITKYPNLFALLEASFNNEPLYDYRTESERSSI